MNRMSAKRKLSVLALLSLIFCTAILAQQPPDNVQGNWTIYSTNIENGEVVVKHVQIAQYGNRLTGYFEGPNQSGPIQGEVNVHHIEFSTVTRNVLTFRGQIYGDNMSGLYGIHGKHAQWQAQRIPPVAQAAPAATTTYQPAPVPQSVPAAAPPQPVAQVAEQPSGAQSNSNPTAAPLSSEQLNSLVAPIALYPDALVAQVLAACANPDQVAYADEWLSQNKNLTGTSLAQAVDQQSWDPSVKALTQFPTVLDNLAHNLSWTSSLGQAFANQQADVMAAVQVMRAKAMAAGTLQSSSQVTVVQQTPSTIVIQPANPQVVYVPQYNPTVVYGAPLVVPMYVAPPVPVAAVGLYFGSGIAIGASFGGGGGGGWGGGFGWGWSSWNVNWGGGWGGGGGGTVIYNHNTYINNRTWNNTNYNNYHPWGPGNQPNGGPHGYVPPQAPNGGRNGDHGLIGGNGGVQKFPDGGHGLVPTQQPNSGREGDRGFGGNGGTQKPDGGHGVVPTQQPNSGREGDRGFGGNGGTQKPDGGHGLVPTQQPNSGREGDRGFGGNNSAEQHDRENNMRSRMAGNGASTRAASARGHESMHPAPQRRAPQHISAPHRSGGGGRRR